ncbi:MAG: hypothetical protein HYZ15_15025 [Sphingobacteriales bacterium]|nr:hypothetical protein [Sphingobacteriales bacterium]
MKYILFSAYIISTLNCFSQLRIDTLKNETVIKLTKSKLPEIVIIQKINQSFCTFDISVDSLIKLKENQVSDNVINLMIQKQGKIDSDNFIQTKNNINEENYIFTESGIYFIRDKKYINLDPTTVSSSKPKSGLYPLGAIGYFNSKYISQIEGSEANYQLNEKKPEFYFNFETIKKSLNDANANATVTENYLDQVMNREGLGSGNYQAISPNDFTLIKLGVKRNKREFTSGKVSVFKYDMSIDGKCIVSFKYEKLSENTYKVYFEKNLSPGEYCFFYLGNRNNSSIVQWYNQNNFKVFDFGISK